jgi:peptidoglycan hydrolase CwlO-like protein
LTTNAVDILNNRRYGIMPSRYVCSVLEEIRDLDKTKRYDRLLGMIEEVQTAVNRMEAKLGDYSSKKYNNKRKIKKLEEKLKTSKKVIRTLQRG